MPNVQKIGAAAAAGSTGNNTHASLGLKTYTDALALKFEVTAAGGTPTVTWKLQGSLDSTQTPDASSDWFDLFALPADSATEVTVTTKTAVGVYTTFIEVARRFCTKVRLVTSANTNITYEADLFSAKF